MQTRATPGLVLAYGNRAAGSAFGHESMTRQELARRLARIKGIEFGGAFDPSAKYDRRIYLVPGHTLIADQARDQFDIRSEHDLFGGVVPYAFMANKTITHPLADAAALAPAGWTQEFAERVHHVVLDGYSAFTRRDALAGALRLFERGSVRLKVAEGIGGSGQWVVPSVGELEARLLLLESEGLLRQGLVLERNLNDVTTLSVGQVCVDEQVVTYFGTQHEVTNNHGHRVYGGSELTLVRGGSDALLALDLARNVRTGVEQALLYDAAARVCFTGAFMSRRNYDIAQGLDDEGEWQSGVLEQSWRPGGASGAEVAALEAFKADPSLKIVRASTNEVYGQGVVVPAGACVYFQGIDERVGPLTKYSQVS
jgi:hypothetical protein